MDPKAKDVIAYHEATKHHYHQYARSPGYMDWENQPLPFRIYEGCERIELPLSVPDPDITYDQMFRRQDIPHSPIEIRTLSSFLALSMGLSAWKAIGSSKWALRMNPSSGNLHPTEAHLLLPHRNGLAAGLYHYSPLFHALERRAELTEDLAEKLFAVLPGAGFFIGLTSIFWREAWKYGERAFRYCNHDVGHALAALSFAAALQGWRVTCLLSLSDAQIGKLLGLDRVVWDKEDAEHPDLLCCVHQDVSLPRPPMLPETLIDRFANLGITGTPNRLSKSYVPWDAIDEVAEHAEKPATRENLVPDLPLTARPAKDVDEPSAQIIRRRRSGVDFDGKAVFPKDRFYSLLGRTLPVPGRPPFDLSLHRPLVHFLLFIHRVDGLKPGLYFFCRDTEQLEALKNAMVKPFLWEQLDDTLPIYLLMEGDVMGEAIQMSCHQSIAGTGCFSLGMISEFGPIVEADAYRYRHLFWEAGIIGQVLYLEAEAHGFRGTGIGCYFDDAVHELLGFRDNTFQSLYHFTIGTPIEDARLTTLPPYHHLDK